MKAGESRRLYFQDFSECPRCGNLFYRGKKRLTLSQRGSYCSEECFEIAAAERREKIEAFILQKREAVLLKEEKESLDKSRVLGSSEVVSDEEYSQANDHFDRIAFLGRYFSEGLADHFSVVANSKDGRRLVGTDRNVDMGISGNNQAYPDLVLVGNFGQESVYGEVGNLSVEKVVQFYGNKRLFWSSHAGVSKNALLLFFDHLVLRRFSLEGLVDFLLRESGKMRPSKRKKS